MANWFGTQATPLTATNGATVVKSAVMFELCNEPDAGFLGANNESAIMKNGGTPLTDKPGLYPTLNNVPFFRYATGADEGYYGPGVIPGGVPGFQQVVNAIRGLGAQNVCILGSPLFSSAPCQYANWFPTDSIGQCALSWHTYPPWPPLPGLGTSNMAFGNGASDSTNNTINAFQGVFNGPIKNGIPVINTEFCGYSSAFMYNQVDPGVQFITQQFDLYGMGGCAWQFNAGGGGGSFTGTLNATGQVTISPSQPLPYIVCDNAHSVYAPNCGVDTPSGSNHTGAWFTSGTAGIGGGVYQLSGAGPWTPGTYTFYYAQIGGSVFPPFGEMAYFGVPTSQFQTTYGAWTTLKNWMVNHA
jgi:hypothetical protein